MAINCDAVWRDSSDYIDGTLAPDLRAAMDAHIKDCRRCAPVVSGLRNIVTLYGDERMAEVPAGFSQRLQRRIEANMPPARRSFFGWAYAVAASLLVAGAIDLSRSSSGEPPIRSKHARRAVKPLPPDLPVVVSKNGKLFHLAKCTFILNRRTSRTILASEATQQGFTPCTRCLNQYL
jgi:hypothetical protein